MSGADLELGALAWLCTYALHSTLLFLAAWLVTTRRMVRSERVKEIVWKTALAGGLFTATTQLALDRPPSGGHWVLGAGAYAAAPADGPASDPGRSARAAERGIAEDAAPPHARGGEDGDPAGILAGGLRWTEWALAGWALGGAALLSLLLVAGGRLRRRLAGRRPIAEGPLPEIVAELSRRAGLSRRVRLTVSPRLRAPVALGTLAPEICLPPRALHGMPRRSQEAMLAHELAHVARFDPLWLGLARVLELVFFFQPLHRVARRRLAESAEFLCDDWALRRTGDRLGLARCLAEVARWLVGDDGPMPACSMADLRSPLGERVERILDERRAAERAPAWLPPAGAALLSAVVMVAPGFVAPAAAAEPVAIPAAPPAATSLAAVLASEWAAIEEELRALELDVAGIRAAAEGRRLSTATRERLAAVEQRARELRSKQRSIRDHLAAWQTLARRDTEPGEPSR